MRSWKTGCKTSSVASAVWHVAPSCWNQMLPISFSSIFGNKNSFSMERWRSPLTVTVSPYSFSKKNVPIIPLDHNPHQTVTRFWCVGFSIYACGFSEPQMQQFCLFTYLSPRSKWASFEKMFFFTKIGSSNILGSTVWLFMLWFIDEDASFFYFFLQDNGHTKLTVFLFFENPYAIFAHILKHYHDFQSNVAIFSSLV